MSGLAPSDLGDRVPGGPAVSREDFDALFDTLAPWKAEGNPAVAHDQAGRLGAVTPEQVLAALSTVRHGVSVSLAHPLDGQSGPDNKKPALHHMTDLGDVEAPEPSAHKDFIGLDYHGKAVSHLDALCHIGYRGQLYGGVSTSEAFSASGSSWAAVTALSGGILVRGVLIDLPRVHGVDWLEPGTPVHREDLLEAESALGVEVGAGDALLLRTGHDQRRRILGPWDSGAASAGLHVDAMPLVAERGVALLGGDGDSDVRPSPVPGVHSPIHALALTALGITLLDNLDLEALSRECAERGRHEFLLVVAPLVVPRGTGSPVNPVAVL
jgi:hypothetical protein